MTKCKEISVKAIIKVDDKFLIFFRDENPILPGGRVENGETIEEALLRELEEETGLSKESFIIKCPFYSVVYESKIYIYYLVDLAEKSLIHKIKLSEEHDDVKLLSLNEIKKYEWVYNIIKLSNLNL